MSDEQKMRLGIIGTGTWGNAEQVYQTADEDGFEEIDYTGIIAHLKKINGFDQ